MRFGLAAAGPDSDWDGLPTYKVARTAAELARLTDHKGDRAWELRMELRAREHERHQKAREARLAALEEEQLRRDQDWQEWLRQQRLADLAKEKERLRRLRELAEKQAEWRKEIEARLRERDAQEDSERRRLEGAIRERERRIRAFMRRREQERQELRYERQRMRGERERERQRRLEEKELDLARERQRQARNRLRLRQQEREALMRNARQSGRRRSEGSPQQDSLALAEDVAEMEELAADEEQRVLRAARALWERENEQLRRRAHIAARKAHQDKLAELDAEREGTGHTVDHEAIYDKAAALRSAMRDEMMKAERDVRRKEKERWSVQKRQAELQLRAHVERQKRLREVRRAAAMQRYERERQALHSGPHRAPVYTGVDTSPPQEHVRRNSTDPTASTGRRDSRGGALTFEPGRRQVGRSTQRYREDADVVTAGGGAVVSGARGRQSKSPDARRQSNRYTPLGEDWSPMVITSYQPSRHSGEKPRRDSTSPRQSRGSKAAVGRPSTAADDIDPWAAYDEDSVLSNTAWRLESRDYTAREAEYVKQRLSLRRIYVGECRRNNLKPNSLFTRTVPDAPGKFDLTELNLNSNYIASVAPFLDIVRLCKGLRRVLLKDNGLSNEDVVMLCRTLQDHPSVQEIDVSGNKSLTVTAGRALQSLVGARNTIVAVRAGGTCIPQHVLRHIQDKVEWNQMGRTISGEEVDAVCKLFAELDTDRDGLVSLQAAAERSKRRKSHTPRPGAGSQDWAARREVAARDAFLAADPDGKRQVGLAEFLQLYFPECPADSIQAAVQRHAVQPPTTVSSDEVAAFFETYAGEDGLTLQRLAEGLGEANVESLRPIFTEYDTNQDDVLSFDEFVRFMTSVPG